VEPGYGSKRITANNSLTANNGISRRFLDMRAKSIKETSSNEIATAFDESMADCFTPTLAILFYL
jgi:hypothetical protein